MRYLSKGPNTYKKSSNLIRESVILQDHLVDVYTAIKVFDSSSN